MWLYIRYWTVVLTDEYFYIYKANYLYDLGWYERAIHNYKRALIESYSQRLRIHDMIDNCYTLLGRGNEGLDYYRKTFENSHDSLIGLGLARAEFDRGNFDRSLDLINKLRNTNHRFDSSKLDILEAKVQVAMKDREQVKHSEEEFKRFRVMGQR